MSSATGTYRDRSASRWVSFPAATKADTSAAGAGSMNMRATSGRDTLAITWFLRTMLPAGSVSSPDSA